MKRFLHLLGVHNWEYEIPTIEKIKERILSDPSGRVWKGFAHFQEATCKICGKSKRERID